MNQTKSAIVTDGLWRKSLSAIRSLGKSGFHVSVMGDSPFTTGYWSRYTRKRLFAPSAAQNPDGFGRALLDELQSSTRKTHGDKPVLFAMEDASLMWIARHRAEVEAHATLLMPDLDSLEIAQDKGATQRVAREMGLPCPKTWSFESSEDFAKLALTLETGKFVAKPKNGSGSAGVVYGDQRSHEEWKSHWNRFGEILIQERVPAEGRGQGVSLLMDREGRCVASFAHERLRQYPVTGGPSTDRRSIHAPEMVEMSIKLLEKLNWRGIAMVEWKLDPSDGNRPKLMEINPRFWGSLELAVRSGVDFPTLFAHAALGEKTAPVHSYPADIRCRWMIPGEILRFMNEPSTDREALGQFLRGLPGLAEEWDSKDLLGTLATVVCTGALTLNPRYWKYVRRG